MLTIDERYLIVRVQGRSLRTLPLQEPTESSRAEQLDLLRGTLDSLRRANAWERRSAIRVVGDMQWEAVAGVIGALGSAQFGHISLGELSPENR
jgi:hypothetical protein